MQFALEAEVQAVALPMQAAEAEAADFLPDGLMLQQRAQ
jgi:hypothetical protein